MAASNSFKFQFLLIAFWLCIALLISPSNSLKCTSQKFRKNIVFSNCTDLPVLNSFLHFTYNSSNSSLSIAFIATPPKPEGWVSWAINPTEECMIGSQALIAFKSDGSDSVTVNTYNISSFNPPVVSKLSFDVWDLSAESDGENFTIFATVKVVTSAGRVNQVWQVGGAVSNGFPQIHAMDDANMNSKGVLELAAPPTAPSEKSGCMCIAYSNIGKWNLVLVSLFILIASVLVV
ncbi:hypothetical protein JCGZ_17727 [Jatropha curcas]|uniref:DOMON domain-containing protein n=1 Tax=Jatropha curcas TaxID=180498 RepID=A0A067K439_JATCU|nr:auxin-induced in root cultures protein 12 [Jatropha curcas]KDP26569.1 hypothetical protein JCGZ_17727 [Jatropha curcas]